MYKESFNRDWTVKKSTGDSVTALMGSASVMGKKVTLPHDAMIEEYRDAKSAAGGRHGFYPGGDYEYSKTFYMDKNDEGKTFVLAFEGIYNRGYIYVNGALAGNGHFGYTGITMDITQYLYFGADNLITVKVINSDVPNSRWYRGSGIFRPVWLYRGEAIRIDIDGLRITTPEISKNIAVVKVDTTICYDANIMKTVTVRSQIRNAEGKLVAEELSPVTLFTDKKTNYSERIYIKNPALWSVDTPNLYNCVVVILDGDIELDRSECHFGIRSLALNPVKGLKINGESILLRGGCVHHDNGPVGAAAFERAEERRIEILKNAGFNSIRVSHNSSSKAMLDACDRLGMLVMEESFDTWTKAKSAYDVSMTFAEHWEEDVEDIVCKDFNHPSVFMYSIGNEIGDISTPEGAKWSRRLTEKFRSLDPTRYVTNGVNGILCIMDELPMVLADLGFITKEQLEAMVSPGGGGGVEINSLMTMLMGQTNMIAAHPVIEKKLKEAFETLDLVGLNYMRGAYDFMKDMPNRVFFGSETFPPDIDLNWEKVKEYPGCIGDYTWTAWDYLGEAGIGVVSYDGNGALYKEYPTYIAYCGDVDITGFRRPISYFREIVFGLRKEPYSRVDVSLTGHTPPQIRTCGFSASGSLQN